MSSRPVRFLTCALVAAAAWLALRNAPTAAQNPPVAGDVERRLKALEEKVERLTEAGKGRPASSTAAQTLADAAEKLRSEMFAQEKRFNELMAQNPFTLGRSYQDAVSVTSERLSQIETKRAECRLELTELHKPILMLEMALKENRAGVPTEDIKRRLTKEQERREEVQKTLAALDKQFATDQTAARELENKMAAEKAIRAEIARVRRAYLAVEAARQEFDSPAK